MRKVVFLFTLSLAIAFTACNKEKINKVNPADVEVSLDKAALQQRIEMINAPLTFNTFKSGADYTPVPELWAIARILPADRVYSTYTFLGEDGSGGSVTDPTTGLQYTRTVATNSAPTGIYTVATPTVPSFEVTFVFSAQNDFDETMSITGAGTYFDATLSWPYVYFTSHVRGDVFGGEIFAVRYYNNVSVDDDGALHAEASIFDNTADYNDLTIDADESTLWVVGDNNARGAIVRNVVLQTGTAGLNFQMNAVDGSVPDYQQTAGVIAQSLVEYNMPLLGPSGNSITIPVDDANTTVRDESQQLWVVAGGTSYGGIAVMDKDDDTRLFTRSDRSNAKHFDMSETSHGSGSYGAFLWGDGNFANDMANLRIFNTSNGPFAYTDYLGGAYGDVTFEGKNAIDVDEDLSGDFYIYMAMGADGVKKVDATTGGVVDSFNGLDTFGGTGLANGLVVHGEFVYVGWGASGLVILNKNTLDVVGQYNGIGSCNYVAVDTSGTEDILFAGFGTGGIVMLKFVDEVNP
jgi:hypothetical protein